jgi:hypothetical protein
MSRSSIMVSPRFLRWLRPTFNDVEKVMNQASSARPQALCHFTLRL